MTPPTKRLATPPKTSHMALSVGFPVKKRENCERNESVSLIPRPAARFPPLGEVFLMLYSGKRGCIPQLPRLLRLFAANPALAVQSHPKPP